MSLRDDKEKGVELIDLTITKPSPPHISPELFAATSAQSSSSTMVDLTKIENNHDTKEDAKPAAAGTARLWNHDKSARKRRRRQSQEDASPDAETPQVVLVRSTAPPARLLDSREINDVQILVQKPSSQITAREAFHCAVCLDSTVERLCGYRLGNCGHLFCRECLYGYIQSKIKDKSVTGCICPECNQRLTLRDVRACTLEVGDVSSWRTFQELATEDFLDSAVAKSTEANVSSNSKPAKTGAAGAAAAQSSLSLRRCPTNHCNYIFVWEQPPAGSPSGELFACPACDGLYCLNCPAAPSGQLVGPAHDQTCHQVLQEIRASAERQRKLEEWKRENAAADARFQELVQRESAAGLTQPCPKCQTLITKNGGCRHMHCTRCHTHFTWGR